jgi:hypothetical protein
LEPQIWKIEGGTGNNKYVLAPITIISKKISKTKIQGVQHPEFLDKELK